MTNVVSEIAHRLSDLLPSHKHTLALLAQVGRKRRGKILGNQNRTKATNVKTEEIKIGKDFLSMSEKDVMMLKFILGVSFPENLLEGTLKSKSSKFLDLMKKNQLDSSFDLDHTAVFRLGIGPLYNASLFKHLFNYDSEVPKPLLAPGALQAELYHMNTQVRKYLITIKANKSNLGVPNFDWQTSYQTNSTESKGGG